MKTINHVRNLAIFAMALLLGACAGSVNATAVMTRTPAATTQKPPQPMHLEAPFVGLDQTRHIVSGTLTATLVNFIPNDASRYADPVQVFVDIVRDASMDEVVKDDLPDWSAIAQDRAGVQARRLARLEAAINQADHPLGKLTVRDLQLGSPEAPLSVSAIASDPGPAGTIAELPQPDDGTVLVQKALSFQDGVLPVVLRVDLTLAFPRAAYALPPGTDGTRALKLQAAQAAADKAAERLSANFLRWSELSFQQQAQLKTEMVQMFTFLAALELLTSKETDAVRLKRIGGSGGGDFVVLERPGGTTPPRGSGRIIRG